jgi:hypothetical protein
MKIEAQIPLKSSKKLVITAIFGTMVLVAMTGMSLVNATGISFAVTTDQTWTWKVSKCVWDNKDSPKFLGKGATIKITGVTTGGLYSWIKGDVTLLNADGSTNSSLSNVLLGNVSSSNPSNLSVYSSPVNFVLPVIIPTPMDQTFAAFARYVNLTFHALVTQYGSQIPFTISNNYTVNTTASTFAVTFHISGSVSGYSISNQPVSLTFTFDSSGVVQKITATALQVAGALDLVLFEIAIPGAESSSTPGYVDFVLFLGAAAAISIIAVKIKRRN